MKNSQWTPVSDRMVLGALSLRFVKGDERCEVDIRDTRWASTEVVVTIYPENATTVKRQY